MRDLGIYEAQVSDNIKLKEKITHLYNNIMITKATISSLDNSHDKILDILTEKM